MEQKRDGLDSQRQTVLYLKLDVVHRWGGDHTVEGGKAMLIANLLAVQFKLRFAHLPIHIQSYHSLKREAGKDHIILC